MKKNNFYQRTITAIAFVIVMIGSILLGQFFFSLLMFAVMVFSFIEFENIIKNKNPKYSKKVALIVGSIIYILLTIISFNLLDYKYLSLILPLVLIVFIFELAKPKENHIFKISTDLLNIVYFSIPLGLSLFLFDNNAETFIEKRILLLAFFATIWLNDSGAYIVGSMFGKHKINQNISPSKTWEGMIGGIFFAVLVGVVFSYISTRFSLTQWIFFSIITSLFAIVGDFVESIFKRETNIKDSGNLLPGHGGILDRFDSTLFSIPFVLAYVILIS